MQRYEYRVVPAPRKGEKAKGVKTAEDRFAHALASVMNAQAADGWEYLRADTLPAEERVGLTRRTTTFQHMLVFRRALVQADAPTLAQTPAPVVVTPVEPAALPEPDPMDQAARRVALTGQPEAGQAPRVALASVTGQAPTLGPARTTGVAPRGGQAAE